MPDVIPTIPQYPEQGIQAELDLVYLWNPNVANELIATLNELLENLPDYSTVMVYKGSVATVADLPATAKIGDVYNVIETDENFCWTGAAWDNLGSIVDLTPYRTSADQDVIDQGLQDQIDLKADASSVYTKSETDGLLATKQDVINDLQTIRSGASAGATAVQPGDLATVATSGSYTDLINKPTLGTAAAEDVSAFASAAQGALADTAVQPADISDMETQTHAANTYATQTTVSGLAEDISDIEGLIPEQATTSNQLADKAFVNSSIATNTAYFVGTFRSVSALQAYSGPVTNNDYAFVTNDVVTDNGNDWATFADLDAYNKSLLTMFDYAWVVNGTKFDLYRFEAISQTWVKRATAIDKESVTLNPVFNRYKATVSGGTTTWGYEYTLNNSSFTADQWTAINSGITPEGVSLIGTALQPGDDVSSLVNDAGYLTTHQSLTDLGITATANELNVLDGITADTTELNYVDGVTSNIQTQLNAKQATLVNQDNIKSVNGNSLLGSGNLELTVLLNYPSGWTTTGTTKAFCDDIAADTTAVAGKAYLGEVTFSDLPGSMANAEVIVKVMYGTTSSNKVIVLTCTSGNVSPYQWQYTYWNNGTNVSGWIGFQPELVSGTNIKTVNGTSLLGSGDLTVSSLPSQTGNSGKYLTTDGTNASWSNKPLVNESDSPNSAIVCACGGASSTMKSGSFNVILGWGTNAANNTSSNVIIGPLSAVSSSFATNSVAIGRNTSANGSEAIALGTAAAATAHSAVISVGGYSAPDRANSISNTLKFCNENGGYEVISADGTIPEARLADTTSVSTGDVLQLDGNGNAVWAPASGLPTQTGHNGEFLTTNGTTASWAAPTVATFRVWGANE